MERSLVVWILLAMAVGINLGNFVSSTGPALQKGKFVGFSVPIGKNPRHTLQITLDVELMANLRDRAAGDDIPDLVQGKLRVAPSGLP